MVTLRKFIVDASRSIFHLMPYIALLNDEEVIPEEIESADEGLECPECDDEMHLTSQYTKEDGTFVARHFSHNPDGSGVSCEGGESETHEKMKSIVISKFKSKHEVNDYELEYSVETYSQTRVADVYIEFKEPTETFGKKLVVECQYRNESKDIQSVTTEYCNQGCSVLWVDENAINDDDVELSSCDLYQPFPYGVPPSDMWGGVWNNQPEVSENSEACVPSSYFLIDWGDWQDSGYLGLKESLRDAWFKGREEERVIEEILSTEPVGGYLRRFSGDADGLQDILGRVSLNLTYDAVVEIVRSQEPGALANYLVDPEYTSKDVIDETDIELADKLCEREEPDKEEDDEGGVREVGSIKDACSAGEHVFKEGYGRGKYCGICGCMYQSLRFWLGQDI